MVKRFFVFLFASVLGIGCGLLAAMNYQVTTVTDESMEPTLFAGQHVLINRMQWGEKNYNRGDIVLFANPMYTETGESAVMMKRIIGIAGEWVSMTGGEVHIDGNPLDESSYLTEAITVGLEGENMVKQFVDGGQFFVLGDDRKKSTDSRNRTVGLVKTEDLQGKVIKIW